MEKIKVEGKVDWEYVEIRVEPSSLLKDRAVGDLCRVASVYL